MENIKIKCRFCGKNISRRAFSSHLRLHDNMKFIDYVNMFKEDFSDYTPCKICGKYSFGIYCTRKCNGIANGNRNKGKQWGVTIDKDCRDIAMKKRRQNQLDGITVHPRLGKKLSDESKKLLSDIALQNAQKPDYKNPMSGKTHTPEAIQKIFTHRYVTTIEQLVKDYLDSCGIEYYFQFFIVKDGVCKSFDFKIKNTNIIIEVDGDYWHGGPGVKKYAPEIDVTRENDKFKTELAKNSGYKVYRFWESELKKDINIIQKNIFELFTKTVRQK